LKINRSGMTLVEILIAVAVIGVLSISLHATFNIGLRSLNRETLALDMQNELRYAMKRLAQDIRESENVILADKLLTLTLDGVDIVYQIHADNNQLTRGEVDCLDPEVLLANVLVCDSKFSWYGDRSIDIDLRVVGAITGPDVGLAELRTHTTVQRRIP
ncbi:PilW family protein, partial [Candidatus Omnitrophota bacterium]